MNPWSVLVCVHVCVAGGLCTHMMNIYACPTPECWHLYTESGIFSLCRLLFIVILVGWDAPCLSSVTARLGLHWGSVSRDDLSGGGYEVRGLGSVCLCSNVDLQRLLGAWLCLLSWLILSCSEQVGVLVVWLGLFSSSVNFWSKWSY